jgi:hypothetical protein
LKTPPVSTYPISFFRWPPRQIPSIISPRIIHRVQSRDIG